MTLFKAVFLGFIQGITEFLPVSSSGHLVLFENFLNLKTENLLFFDLILHLGTLFALIIYFKKDFFQLFKDFFASIKSKKIIKNDVFSWFDLLLALIPIIIGALLFKDYLDLIRKPIFVYSFMFFTGIVLFLAETLTNKNNNKWGIKDSFLVGLFQVLAILPGVSRSGMTISAALFRNKNKFLSAKFSFLLGALSVFCASFYEILSIFLKNTVLLVSMTNLLAGFISSFLFSYFCVYYFLKLIKKQNFKIFAYYLFIISFLGLIFEF